MRDLVAAFLEASGPLSVLGAQAIYVSQPLLDSLVPGEHLSALAEMLEDGAKTQAFVTYLREATTP